MTEPTPPAPTAKSDDELEEFDLPFFQRLALQLQVLVLGIVIRLTDVLLLLGRPRLLRPYLSIWWAELRHTPYKARRTFEVVRALKTTGQRFRELIYGETPLLTAVSVFKRAGVGPGSRLVDLGAGRGRVLIAARWLGAEALGVELLADHVARVAEPLRAVGATLTVGDMTQTQLGEASHIFTNWLALSPETKARLVERFRTCKPGTRIITVTRPIEAEGFVLLSRHWRLFTWGVEVVWIQEYRPAAPWSSPPGRGCAGRPSRRRDPLPIYVSTMEIGTRRMLGGILVERGVIDRAQLRVGLVHHHEARVPLGRALVREGICTEQEVLQALSTQLGVASVELEREPLDRKLARLVPRRVARQYRVIPLRLERQDREVLHVALPAPASIEALDAVRAVSGKPRVEPHLASDPALTRALFTLYGIEESAEESSDEATGAGGAPAEEAPLLLYGWPPVTAVLITRLLARHGYTTKVATPLEVLHTSASDIVLAPMQAMEGLLMGEARLAGALIVHGASEDEGFERAQKLGAKGYLANALDDELLLRAIRRLRPPASGRLRGPLNLPPGQHEGSQG